MNPGLGKTHLKVTPGPVMAGAGMWGDVVAHQAIGLKPEETSRTVVSVVYFTCESPSRGTANLRLRIDLKGRWDDGSLRAPIGRPVRS